MNALVKGEVAEHIGQRGRVSSLERAQGALTGKRGRHKQSVQFILLTRLHQYAADVWRFAADVGVAIYEQLGRAGAENVQNALEGLGLLSHERGGQDVLCHPLLSADDA